MLKENGMEKPADKKETSSSKGKTAVCPRCANNFEVGTSTVFGEDYVCPSCGHAFAN